MANITLKGNPISTLGELPEKNSQAIDFTLVAQDLSEKKLSDYNGKIKILNIVPSLDTGVCAASARKFNTEASSLTDTVILVISKDLPFAMKRFCEVEGLENVISLSAFRSNFTQDYNLEITTGPLKGLASRCVIILDKNNNVIYTEQVKEITEEPDYNQALEITKNL